MKPLRIHFVVDMEEKAYAASPHLGIGYLSAFLKKSFDNIHISLSYMSGNIVPDIEKHKPDILGFSCTSRHFVQFEKIAGEVKARFYLPIIFGGVHISIAPRELPESACVGVLVEGEETLKQLLENFEDNRFNNLEGINGIVYRKAGRIFINPKRQYIQPLDTLPFRDLSMRKVLWDKNHRAVIVTSRGCPYKCWLCASSVFWDRTRLHSAEYVVREMKELVGRFNVREILVYDDFFQ